MIYTTGAIRAAKAMFVYLLNNMLKVPMSFFFVTPVGRILARFSNDTDVVDNRLRMHLNKFFRDVFRVGGS